MEPNLSFTTKKSWTLRVPSFENFTQGSGMEEPFNIPVGESDEKIHKRVLKMITENDVRKSSTNGHTDVIYAFYVDEFEEMTDDREKFGHSNMTSSKFIRNVVPRTYVRGKVKTLSVFLEECSTGRMADFFIKRSLMNFIVYKLKFDRDNLTDKELGTRIILVLGDGERQSFFELFKEDSRLKVSTPVTV